MASISDRWHSKGRSGERLRTRRYGTGKRWQVRYRDPAGASRNRSFERRADAERFMASISVELMRGDYVDPRAGRLPFGRYADVWLERQILAPTSRRAAELRLKKHL